MATTYVYWVVMPAGSSTGSDLNPVEPKGSQIIKVVQGSTEDQTLNNGGTITVGGRQWQPFMVGSFSSEAEAKKAAPPSGLDFIGTVIGSVPGGLQAGGGTNPFSAIANAADAIGKIGEFILDAWKNLTNWRMWASLGWIILGIGLFIAGLVLWVGPDILKNLPIPIPL